MLVQCLLHQLAAKNYISDRQCSEFLSDVHNIAETARQDCDKNRSLEEEVWLVSFTVIRNTQIHTRLTALLTGIARVSWFQKGKTNLDFTEARDSEWQWHHLGHMQICTLLQTDNHASTPPLSFFTGRMPFLSPNQQRQSTVIRK